MTRTGQRGQATWIVIALFVSLLAGRSIPSAALDPSGAWERETWAGLEAYRQGRYSAARQRFERALETASAFSPGDRRRAASLNNLAAVLETLGRYGEAEALYRRAVEEKERTFGRRHPAVAMSLNNLALLYDTQGRRREAQELYSRAEEMLEPSEERRWGAELATIRNNFGRSLLEAGRIEEAEKKLRSALELRRQALGPTSPLVAQSLANLASLEKARGRYGEAERLYREALALQEKVLGPRHPDLANPLTGLGAIARLRRRYDGARELYEGALALRESALGPAHPDVAATLNDLGLVYRSEGNLERAETLYRRALQIWEAAFGQDHPEVATVLHNLGSVALARRDFPEAEALIHRSVEISERVLPPEHPDLAVRYATLGEFYRARGESERAEEWLDRALEVGERAFGSGHPQLEAIRLAQRKLQGEVRTADRAGHAGDEERRSALLYELGERHRLEGRLLEARELLRESLSLRERVDETANGSWLPILESLAWVALGTGDAGDAVARLEQAVEIARSDPTVRRDLPRLLRELSAARRSRGDWDGAVSAARQALVESQRPEPSPAESAAAARALGFALLAVGNGSGALSAFEAVGGTAMAPAENRDRDRIAAEGRVRALWMLGREAEATLAERDLEALGGERAGR